MAGAMQRNRPTLASTGFWASEFKQWGSLLSGNNWDIFYPVAFSQNVYGVLANDYSAENGSLQYIGIHGSEQLNKFKMYTSAKNDVCICYIAIGR